MEDFYEMRRRRNRRNSKSEDDPPGDMETPFSCDNISTTCVTTADSKGGTAIQSESEFSGTEGSDLTNRSSDFTYEERVERYQLRKKERIRRRSSANLGKPTGGCFQTAVLPEMLKRQGLHIDNLKYIGGGTFARVYRGSWCGGASGRPASSSAVAVKCIRSRHLYNPARKPKWLEREAQMAQIKKHENLVQIIDVSIDQEPCVLVMEYCAGGSIYDLLHTSAGGTMSPAAAQKPALSVINWCQRMKVAMDVAAGMAHLHSMGILHRDLKTANVMLLQPLTGPAMQPHAKIGDFGLARFLEERLTTDKHSYLSLDVGSSIYMAPEVFACMAEQGKAPYTNKMDVYSYSMMLYELLTDCLPYQGREELKSHNPQGVGHLVGREHVRPDVEQIPKDAPGVLQGVMHRAWVSKPTERPAFREILQELDPAYMSLLYHSHLGRLSASNPFSLG